VLICGFIEIITVIIIIIIIIIIIGLTTCFHAKNELDGFSQNCGVLERMFYGRMTFLTPTLPTLEPLRV